MKKCEGCDRLESIIKKGEKREDRIDNFEVLLKSNLDLFARTNQRQFTLEQNDLELKQALIGIREDMQEMRRKHNDMFSVVSDVKKQLPKIEHTTNIISSFDRSVEWTNGTKWLLGKIFKITLGLSLFGGAVWGIVESIKKIFK